VNGSISITVASVFTATATSVTLHGTGSAAITAVVSATTLLFPATVTPALPARQVTVGQFPAANPNWVRSVQLSDEYLFVKRGLYGVAIALSDVVNLALAQEVNLTWTPPVILTQPVAATCAGTAAATGTLTGSGSTDVSDGDTVTIGSLTYRFKTTMSNAYDVQLTAGTGSDTSMNNLIDAINGTGTAGTNWYGTGSGGTSGSIASPVVSAGALTSHAFTVTALAQGLAGNTIATTKSSSIVSWGGSTLSGGTSAAASFTVVPGSEYALTYQWQWLNGSTWTNISGTVNGTAYTNYTTATLTCTPSTNGQNGIQHRCVVTDDAGSFGLTNGAIDTAAVVLTIN